jgi:hypothetical protein
MLPEVVKSYVVKYNGYLTMLHYLGGENYVIMSKGFFEQREMNVEPIHCEEAERLISEFKTKFIEV